MSALPLPPGAQRLTQLVACVSDLDAAVGKLRNELPQVNDPGLRPRVIAFVQASDAMLSGHGAEPGPDVADRLNALLNGVHELAIPARDPDLGPTRTLEQIERATGLVAIRLIKALDAAAALGWHPKRPELPERLTATAARKEVGSLLDRIAARLDAVGASLDQLVAANESAKGFPQQKGLMNFYVGSVRVEINLAKMQLTVGETSVDFAALWRACETIADLTADFHATLWAWAHRVSDSVIQAAERVRRRVRKMVSGVETVVRFVVRKRRRNSSNWGGRRRSNRSGARRGWCWRRSLAVRSPRAFGSGRTHAHSGCRREMLLVPCRESRGYEVLQTVRRPFGHRLPVVRLGQYFHTGVLPGMRRAAQQA